MTQAQVHCDLPYKKIYRVYTKDSSLPLVLFLKSSYRVYTKVYSTCAKTFLISAHRDCTKVSRVHTKIYRVYTIIAHFFHVLLPCLSKRITVTTRNTIVARRKFIREQTKLYRVYTKIKPCLHENENTNISDICKYFQSFFIRMYVSNLFKLKKILTTTYVSSQLDQPCLNESKGNHS